MIPVAVAGLVGVLLGALVVVLGVLAGKSPACCCNGSIRREFADKPATWRELCGDYFVPEAD